MIHLVLALLLVTGYVDAVGLEQRPNNAKDALDYEVDPRDTRRHAPMTQREQDNWFRRHGQPLTAGEIKTMRAIIDSSQCTFVDYTGNRIKPGYISVPAPKCASGSTTLKQCMGRIKCDNPTLTYYVGARCLVPIKAECPEAKSCAMQTDISLNAKNINSNKEITVGNMWAWGYSE